jgi:hypothetical protein
MPAGRMTLNFYGNDNRPGVGGWLSFGGQFLSVSILRRTIAAGPAAPMRASLPGRCPCSSFLKSILSAGSSHRRKSLSGHKQAWQQAALHFYAMIIWSLSSRYRLLAGQSINFHYCDASCPS